MALDRQLAELVDEREIHAVVHRYCRGVDRRDYDLVRSCYHDDAFDDHGAYSGGVDGFIEHIRTVLPRYEGTMHFTGNVLLELDGDAAGVESYAIAHHRLAPRGSRPRRDYVVGLRYVDRFERRPVGWRISERRCLFDWSRLDEVPPGGELGAHLTPGVPSRSDPSYGYLGPR